MTMQMQRWAPRAGVEQQEVGRVVCGFLDVASTSMGRETHYNTRDEQQAAELSAHRELLALDRGLYALLMLLPGSLDRARQLGLRTLLSEPDQGTRSLLNDRQELEILTRLSAELPPHRLLNVVLSFRTGDERLGVRKTSGGRMKRLVLRTLLGSRRLELWSVKYRRKMREALTHAWGRKMATTLRLVLSKPEWSEREQSILDKHVLKHRGGNEPSAVLECVAFVLEAQRGYTLPLLSAVGAAREDLEAGSRLPPEVLEGIRSVFHADIPHARVLELTARSGAMTQTQRRKVQKSAAKAGVQVAWDPSRERDAVKLYLYAFEQGMSEAIAARLDALAQSSVASFPARYQSIGVLLDASASMAGTDEQKLRPMATALALRDMLRHTSAHARVVLAGGVEDGGLVRPGGCTDLASGLVSLLGEGLDAIYVVSDGYENAPAGRFAEVIDACRRARIEVPPVLHFNPVLAAEAKGVRELCPRDPGVPTLPASNPGALGLGMVRGLLQSDPVKGVNVLVERILQAERRLSS